MQRYLAKADLSITSKNCPCHGALFKVKHDKTTPLMCLFLQTPLGRKEENPQWAFGWACKTNWQDKVAKTKTKTPRQQLGDTAGCLWSCPSAQLELVPPSPCPSRSIEALWQPIDGLCSAQPSIATCLPSSSSLLLPLYLINAAHSSWLFPYWSTVSCMGKASMQLRAGTCLETSALGYFLKESFVPTG